jgi:hypothetical protein
LNAVNISKVIEMKSPTTIRYLVGNPEHRHLDATSLYFIAMNKAGEEASVSLVSGIGAIVGCTVVALILVTAYMAFRVYK